MKTIPSSTKQADATGYEYRKITVDGVLYYGKHLILTAKGCNQALKAKQAVVRFLRELVPAIDMKAYGDPIVERFGDGDDVGISAVQLIYTSAITIHTNDMYRDMYLDVFSCKPFNAETVVERVRRAFAPAEVNHQLLYRR